MNKPSRPLHPMSSLKSPNSGAVVGPAQAQCSNPGLVQPEEAARPDHHHLLLPSGRGSYGEEAGMSVFGGDSWARDAQQRKRRLQDLLLPAPSSSSPSAPDSFRRLPNGKLACLVCPHRPVLDSPLMLSMHNKGARHMAAESRLREKEQLKQHEINKRVALSSDNTLSNSGYHVGVKPSNMKEKPLIEQTRRAILEAQSTRLNNFNANNVSRDQKRMANDSSSGSHVSPGVPMENLTGNAGLVECKGNKGEPFVANQSQGKLLVEWQADLRKRQEQELKFTASGWKRDCHGKWYRDENVEFDSDEDDPNICLS